MFGIAKFEDIRKNLKKHKKIFQEWFKKGYGADMDYLKKMENDRYHPESKLTDAKSVIVLGAIYSDNDYNSGYGCGYSGGCLINHNSSHKAVAGSHNCSVVARYARGKDYHKILKKKLVELSDWLKTEFPKSQPKADPRLAENVKGQRSIVETYVSVDSGPTVDRVLAESAGLGFFGKNTCIIDPSRGSFFFIASVLTNIELPATDKRRMPNCGNCERCIQNCPTGALVAPGVLDARKCISYLTIENKGGIPEELRAKIGNRIFGCDECQKVCPFNVGRAHHQQITIDKLKAENGVGMYLDLKEILSIQSDEEFQQKFAGTPLMRAKRRGLIRNACVVAGNCGIKKMIPYLKKIIEDESDEMIKGHAKWAILKLKI